MFSSPDVGIVGIPSRHCFITGTVAMVFGWFGHVNVDV